MGVISLRFVRLKRLFFNEKEIYLSPYGVSHHKVILGMRGKQAGAVGKWVEGWSGPSPR